MTVQGRYEQDVNGVNAIPISSHYLNPRRLSLNMVNRFIVKTLRALKRAPISRTEIG